jgi:hypothetical protein
MAKFAFVFVAATTIAAAGAVIAQEKPLGPHYQSAAGPEVAFIPSFATGDPAISVPTPHITPDLLASTGAGSFYKPAPLGDGRPLGPDYQSPAGPQVAFIPSVNTSPEITLATSDAAARETQLGAVPEDQPER